MSRKDAFWNLNAYIVCSVMFLTTAGGVPPGFPASGNGLWYTSPASSWSREFLPIGNGYLAAMTPGGTIQETTQLNIESLWSGGPFADPLYNGGNKQPSEQASMAEAMHNIRQSIFQSSNGEISNVDVLATDADAYGSYASAGYLLCTLNVPSQVTNYTRWLDLDQATAHTTFTLINQGLSVSRTSFCTHPSHACIQRTSFSLASSSHPSTAPLPPSITYAFSPLTLTSQGLPQPTVTCLDGTTMRLTGTVSNPGMAYEILARVQSTSGPRSIKCQTTSANATITVSNSSDSYITWVGGTNYDMDAGDAAHNFSFKGADPHASLLQLLNTASPSSSSTSSSAYQKSFNSLFQAHLADIKDTFTGFSLSLGSPNSDATTNLPPTDVLRSSYQIDVGNTYLETLLFNYARYLLWSSARGTLPANLQGKWGDGYGNPWGADYHANINLQMNYWAAEMANLDVMQPVFDYIQKTWAPRGAYTASVLYNISRGWTTHNEMNTFGHTGMKPSAQWGDYTEAATWMMVHVWDHFDYTSNVQWWKTQGWPLIKSVAQFHLDQLIPDLHFNDSTLVINPCNSPEQPPITFGCAHAQQLIWQLFNAVEKGFEASGDTDTAFLEEVKAKKAQMDKGLRIGSWGQLQEWKVDLDSPTDTHRHLSHLIGLYPGYAVASYDPAIQGPLKVKGVTTTYTKQQVIEAATTSLIHRGNGTGPDADSGWEKAWRAAAWAQLGNASEFYHILSYAITRDFGPNLFSLYNPFDPNPIFQIDANLGYPGAVLNAILQAPDVPSLSTPLTITLLPALPQQWASGSIKGARVRGGISIDMTWNGGRAMSVTLKVDRNARGRPVRVVHAGKMVASFNSVPGSSRSVSV